MSQVTAFKKCKSSSIGSPLVGKMRVAHSAHFGHRHHLAVSCGMMLRRRRGGGRLVGQTQSKRYLEGASWVIVTDWKKMMTDWWKKMTTKPTVDGVLDLRGFPTPHPAAACSGPLFRWVRRQKKR